MHRGDHPALRTRSPARFAAGTEQPGQACVGAIVVGRFAEHALRAVRQFLWLEVDSVKMALSRPAWSSTTVGRSRHTRTPQGHTQFGKNTLGVFRERKSWGGWEFQNLQKANDKRTIGTYHEILWQTLCQTCQSLECYRTSLTSGCDFAIIGSVNF